MSDDRQREEWEAFEAKELSNGRCPYGGDALVRRQYDDGPACPTGKLMSCAMCDCFGFDATDERIPRRLVGSGSTDQVSTKGDTQ